MSVAGGFVFGDFAVLMLLLLIVSTLSSSICLPFVFKLGVGKGRTACYIMIGFVCGASVLAPSILRGQLIVNFTAIIEKYLDIKELNKTVLNELIDKIEVHEAEKIDGKRVQKVDIYYRFIGNLN